MFIDMVRTTKTTLFFFLLAETCAERLGRFLHGQLDIHGCVRGQEGLLGDRTDSLGRERETWSRIESMGEDDDHNDVKMILTHQLDKKC